MRVEFLNSESSMLLYTLEKTDVDHIDHLLKQVDRYKNGRFHWDSMFTALIDPLSIKLVPLVYEERTGALMSLNRYVVRLDDSEKEYTEWAKKLHPIYPLYGKMLKQLLAHGRPQEPDYLKRELEKYGLNRFGMLEYSLSSVHPIGPYNEDPFCNHCEDPDGKMERWLKAKGYLDSLSK